MANFIIDLFYALFVICAIVLGLTLVAMYYGCVIIMMMFNSLNIILTAILKRWYI